MNTEIVTPRPSEDGIVFYVSASGDDTGISIRGLEKLGGYEPQGNLFSKTQLFNDMENGMHRENIPECLQPVWGKVFNRALKGSDGARIVTAQAAVAIIEYRAFVQNIKVARESFRKFSQIGFDTWVKKVVNFSNEPLLNPQLLQALQILNDKLDAVSSTCSKWNRIEGITATVYPGLKMFNDSLSNEDINRLMPSEQLYTINDWCNLKGIVLDRSTMSSFSRQASDTFKTFTGDRPKVKYSKSARTNRQRKEGNGYKLVDFNILEAAWQTFSEKLILVLD